MDGQMDGKMDRWTEGGRSVGIMDEEEGIVIPELCCMKITYV